MLTIIDNQLIAIKPDRTITLSAVSDQDQAKATARWFGISTDMAHFVLHNSLPLGKLITQKD